MSTFDFAGRTVLITGSSLGLGEAFARELSRRGAALVLVGGSEAKLTAVASKLDRAHIVPIHLNAAGAAQHVFDAVAARGLEVDVLLNNAGVCTLGTGGDGQMSKREESNGCIDALVELTHLFMPTIERRQGGVIQIAPLPAFHASPYISVYGAFLLAFSEALFAEYRPRGVRVLALSVEATEAPKKVRSDQVVRSALEVFVTGRSSVLHDPTDNAVISLSRHLNRELSAKIVARMARPNGSVHLERLPDTTLSKTAVELAMSPRTLQRKLKEHGRSFNSVVDDVRRELAIRHLADESFNLDDLAFLLGFSNPSAFHRAFKRWTGDAPGAYRKRLHAGEFQGYAKRSHHPR